MIFEPGEKAGATFDVDPLGDIAPLPEVPVHVVLGVRVVPQSTAGTSCTAITTHFREGHTYVRPLDL